MDVIDAIQKRRAYRALGPAAITDDMVKDLVGAAQLSASCFNNQPWRFVFARSAEALARVHEGLNKTNGWAFKAPLIIAAFAKKENDCLIKEREFYLFDLGMAVSALLLRATELGLVAHPIAGFDPDKIRAALNIPEGNMVLTLVIVGKKTDDLSALTPGQAGSEGARPPRLALENIYAIDSYNDKMSVKVEH
jgi:nitroreductase